MKIEIDHQELQSILEHIDQDKVRMHQKIRIVLEPFAQMTARVASDHFSGPKPVPEGSTDDGADEGADASTGTQG